MVGLETYRARIGMHAMHGAREPRGVNRSSLIDVHTITAVYVVGIVLGLLSGHVIAAVCSWHYVTSMRAALCGEHVLSQLGGCLELGGSYGATRTVESAGLLLPTHHIIVSLPGTQYSYDCSFLLILSGMVEVNPGPDIKMEDLQKLLGSLREDIQKDTEKSQRHESERIMTELGRVNDNVKRMEDKLDKAMKEINEINDKLQAQDEHIEYLSDNCPK